MEPDRTCLRRARLAAGVDLSELARRTRISPTVLKSMDAGNFERLPAGIYARSYVRSVASALGLDPAATLASLEVLLPGGDVVPTAAVPAVTTSTTGQAPAPSQPPVHHAATLWTTATDRRLLQQAAASFADAAILCVIHAATFVGAMLVAGAGPHDVWEHGALGIVAIWVVTTALYYLMFAGIRGLTPGERLTGGSTEAPRAVTLGTIARRALAAFLAEASIGVDLVYRTEIWSSAFPVRSTE